MLCDVFKWCVWASQPGAIFRFHKAVCGRFIDFVFDGGARNGENRPAMKLKVWVVWLCVAVLLASEVFLFVTKTQKDEALVKLREAKTELEQLHSQLDQLKNSSVATLSSDNARLRAENQGFNQKFPQLQNEIRQLQQQVQKLTQQLDTARNAAQQQQQQMQQIQEATQQASQPANPAPEPAAEAPASAVAQLNACVNNLRQIDAAKQQWALENNKTAAALPTVQELLPYFADDVVPVCPAGGIYTLNAAGQAPTCSIPGHVLPP
jgi:septal ring factor EnvC (AmiA/AmiB activator)